MKRALRRIVIALLGVVVIWSGWQAARTWHAWEDIERIPFDLDAARSALAQRSTGPSSGPTGPATVDPTDATPFARSEAPSTTSGPAPADALASGLTTTTQSLEAGPVSPPEEDGNRFGPPAVVDDFRTLLLVGDDNRVQAPGARADTIMLFIQDGSNSSASLISLPRDLLVTNPCTGSGTRLAATLKGCEELASGPELLALAVEDFTGLHVDHFALVGLGAFQQIVDAFGGVEICVEYSVRLAVGLQPLLPEGCTLANGATALAWVRTRTPQELVDGEWRAVPGASDLTRARHQQDLVLELASRLKGLDSPAALAGIAEKVAAGVALDAGLSFSDAVTIAWDLRHLDTGSIRRPELPVHSAVTADGVYVLLAEGKFADLLDPVAASFPVSTPEPILPEPAGGEPPVMSRPVVSAGTVSATVRWTTDRPATAAVHSRGVADPATDNRLSVTHAVALHGLAPGSTYLVEVVSTSAEGVSAEPIVVAFSTRPAPAPSVRDLTGDGDSDLVWVSFSTGELAVWEMHATTFDKAWTLPMGVDTWQLVGAGDMTGDDRADLVWHDASTGAVVMWDVAGASVDVVPIGDAPPPWMPVAVADTNGDGHSDVVWRNQSTGENAAWVMDGTRFVYALGYPGRSGPWVLAGAGDLDGDESADLVWRDPTTGRNEVWSMVGAEVADVVPLERVEGDWVIGSVADYSGDGLADLVWRNPSTGENLVWVMHGSAVETVESLATVSPDWLLAGP